ncbi:unnamed protein product [Rangifer tarandus platyrhynchus]|uniref:Uncharacterized protein n=1 Tax=Rangifer tarandus platyrhynchus TaxID=3082113 RepID=A0ABN8Z4Y7_RANTA|nr:unnamed protein product [Rangifer tarandus platyrhynchus]
MEGARRLRGSQPGQWEGGGPRGPRENVSRSAGPGRGAEAAGDAGRGGGGVRAQCRPPRPLLSRLFPCGRAGPARDAARGRCCEGAGPERERGAEGGAGRGGRAGERDEARGLCSEGAGPERERAGPVKGAEPRRRRRAGPRWSRRLIQAASGTRAVGGRSPAAGGPAAGVPASAGSPLCSPARLAGRLSSYLTSFCSRRPAPATVGSPLARPGRFPSRRKQSSPAGAAASPVGGPPRPAGPPRLPEPKSGP